MWFTEAPTIMLHQGWPLTHWDELAGTLSVSSTRIWLDLVPVLDLSIQLDCSFSYVGATCRRPHGDLAGHLLPT